MLWGRAKIPSTFSCESGGRGWSLGDAEQEGARLRSSQVPSSRRSVALSHGPPNRGTHGLHAWRSSDSFPRNSPTVDQKLKLPRLCCCLKPGSIHAASGSIHSASSRGSWVSGGWRGSRPAGAKTPPCLPPPPPHRTQRPGSQGRVGAGRKGTVRLFIVH